MLRIILIICIFYSYCLGPLPVGVAFDLPAPDQRIDLSAAFVPVNLKGLKVYPHDPFHFEFILDQGNDHQTSEALTPITKRLIKYFFASMAIPEKDLWVNLSPYEKNRIIPPDFGQTDMGCDLLAQDYILKQMMASLIYPEGHLGQKFWSEVYREAAQKFGTTDIPVNTFNKVWIVPQKAAIYEHGNMVYIVDTKLKVMLDEDYLAGLNLKAPSLDGTPPKAAAPQDKHIHALASDVIRSIILPEIEKEVNEGQHFAQLRQIYNSLILAAWYKKKIRDSLLNRFYSNSNKIGGLKALDIKEPLEIYQQYLKAFKKGVYNYIKEEQDPLTQQVVARKYFSGGVTVLGYLGPAMVSVPRPRNLPSNAMMADVKIGLLKKDAAMSHQASWALESENFNLSKLIPEALHSEPIQIVLIADNSGTLTEHFGRGGLDPRMRDGLKDLLGGKQENYLIVNTGDPKAGLEAGHRGLMADLTTANLTRRYFSTWAGGTANGYLHPQGSLRVVEKIKAWPMSMRRHLSEVLAEAFYEKLEGLFKSRALKSEDLGGMTLKEIQEDHQAARDSIAAKYTGENWRKPKDEKKNIITSILSGGFFHSRDGRERPDSFIYDDGAKLAIDAVELSKKVKFLNVDFFGDVERLARSKLDYQKIESPVEFFAGSNFLDVVAKSKSDAVEEIIRRNIPPLKKGIRLYVVIGDGGNDVPTMRTNFARRPNEFQFSVFMNNDKGYARDLSGPNIFVSKKNNTQGTLGLIGPLNVISGKTVNDLETRRLNSLQLRAWRPFHWTAKQIAKQFGLNFWDSTYFNTLLERWNNKTPDPSIGENFTPSAYLPWAVQQKIMGVRSGLEIFKDEENLKAAKAAHVHILELKGGFGNALKRLKTLMRVTMGLRTKEADKSLDIFKEDVEVDGFDSDRRPKTYTTAISIGEIKLLRYMDLMDFRNSSKSPAFASIEVQEAVHEESEALVNELWDSVYIGDRFDNRPGAPKRTYRQIFNGSQGLKLDPEFIKQGLLPVIDKETGAILNNPQAVAPGGHGFYVIRKAHENSLNNKDLSKDQVSVFASAEGVNSMMPPEVIGYQLRNNFPVVLLGTSKQQLDTKGGLLGLMTKLIKLPEIIRQKILKNKTIDPKDLEPIEDDLYPNLDEIAQARGQGQEALFQRQGLRAGLEGMQIFNTNVHSQYHNVLDPYLHDLRKAIGNDEFGKIAPDLIRNPSKKIIDGQEKEIIKLEGASGAALLALNKFIIQSKDPRVMDVREKYRKLYGIDRLVYIVNLEPEIRSEGYTSGKYAWDYYIQFFTDIFKFHLWKGRLQFTPAEGRKLLPGINLVDPFYTDTENLIDSLGRNLRIKYLDYLGITGIVKIANAVLKGTVIINNQSGREIDLAAPELRHYFKSEDGRLLLDNVRIDIDKDGQISVQFWASARKAKVTSDQFEEANPAMASDEESWPPMKNASAVGGIDLSHLNLENTGPLNQATGITEGFKKEDIEGIQIKAIKLEPANLSQLMEGQ